MPPIWKAAVVVSLIANVVLLAGIVAFAVSRAAAERAAPRPHLATAAAVDDAAEEGREAQAAIGDLGTGVSLYRSATVADAIRDV
jgi:hypothetical protein